MISLPQKLHTALDVLWTFSRSNVVCQPSLWIDAFRQAPNRLKSAPIDGEQLARAPTLRGNCKSNCLVVDKLVNAGLITSRLHWWTSWDSRGARAHR